MSPARSCFLPEGLPDGLAVVEIAVAYRLVLDDAGLLSSGVVELLLNPLRQQIVVADRAQLLELPFVQERLRASTRRLIDPSLQGIILWGLLGDSFYNL